MGLDTLVITKGEDLLTKFASSANMNRFHCSKCGSPVMNESAIPSFLFRDAPLALFKRDKDGQIIGKDKLMPSIHIHYPSRVRNHVDDRPKFDTDPGSGNMLKVDAEGNVIGIIEKKEAESKNSDQ
eukprot:TRINITY_DN25191_c0_g1_i2.p2 TRINITY_DN25191_c0_g1~~TRINITY_DN25191_c0_g1_i2.p2  ORF type:complete len:126 (+),score=65.64 TRINITY_DN25191_c0_g1_i2:249-626(+)